MPRARQVDNPETEVYESQDVDGSDAMPVQGFHIPAKIEVVKPDDLTEAERAGYVLALRSYESLRLTTFCENEAKSMRVFIDKLESLFGKP